jgi:lipoate synthase
MSSSPQSNYKVSSETHPIPQSITLPLRIRDIPSSKRGRKPILRSDEEILALHAQHKLNTLSRYYTKIKPQNDYNKPINVLQRKYDELLERFDALSLTTKK